MDIGHWILNEPMGDEAIPYGFIYLITNLKTNKKYIGKKQCWTILKRKPLKGKTKKRWEDKETDWRTYTSSSREVNEDIQKFGKENFEFRILRFCDNKAQLAYWEAKQQFDCNVLLCEDYYNGIINLRIGRRGLISERNRS